jgi:hypothetical protein
VKNFYSKITKHHPNYLENNEKLNILIGHLDVDSSKNLEGSAGCLDFANKDFDKAAIFCSKNFEHTLTFAYLYDIVDG